MTRTARIWLVVAALLLALLVGAKLRYAGEAPVNLADGDCNADLWKHVYQPQRLRVIQPCTSVQGKVDFVHRASDGDLHIGLDPDRASVLNLINMIHGRGKLAVEIICEHSTAVTTAAAACGDFRSAVTIPAPGDHIRVTGAYVTDRDNGWNEVHPVTRIEILHP